MLTPEYEEFRAAIGDMLELPSERALVLRQQLGIMINKKTSKFPKGQIQQKKMIFIETALAVSGVSWNSDFPYKIISSLKNNGAGDEGVALELVFLCSRTKEFEEIRTSISSCLGKGSINNILNKTSLPPNDLYLADILSGQFLRKFYAAQMAREEAGDNEQAPSSNGDVLLTDYLASLEDRRFGRNFLEKGLYEFVQGVSREQKSSISIIDVDDMSKINKVYGRDLGDFVLKYLINIIGGETKYFYCQFGRCGDDTFYVA